VTERVSPGYGQWLSGGARAVARDDVADDIRGILDRPETLHDFASRVDGAQTFHGRGPVFAIALPRSGIRVVVRHNRHGGLLAPLTRDLFVTPTHAPRELALSLALAKAGVPTPAVVAYAVYPSAVPTMSRADIVTEEIIGGRDLGDVLITSDATQRTSAWEATARLVASMVKAGVRHHDLNVKNILIRRFDGAMEAFLLDVDRVELFAKRAVDPGELMELNCSRLARSAVKRRRLEGAQVSDEELNAFRLRVQDLSAE
jgi:hypothetical protein